MTTRVAFLPRTKIPNNSMSICIDIENQCFTFGNNWTFAFKYDDTNFYRKSASKLQGDIDGIPHSTKAVDIVGIHKDGSLLLLEAKDFRGHRIENKGRMNGEVSLEAAVKSRDTVAALVGAARKSVDEFKSDCLMDALKNGKEVKVVLWLEDDTFQDVRKTKQTLSALTGKLKSKLSWMNVKTLVLSSSVDNRLPDLTVSNVQGAGQP